VMLAVLILDRGFVVAKRIQHGHTLQLADRWHLADVGFSQRRTLAYMYGWTLVLAGLAVALRFVPDSDGALWAAVTALGMGVALAAGVYLVVALEILKLRHERLRQVFGLRQEGGRPTPSPEEVDRAVARELETGEFPAVDPETGEFEAIEKG
jgi:UDP-GlcNAc:undecaprenyl-phosphate/decaprenyl-phosphate GlcNAc-1-phosphate transferase